MTECVKSIEQRTLNTDFDSNILMYTILNTVRSNARKAKQWINLVTFLATKN